MNNEEIIYSINIEDIQTVANQELERDLSVAEIEKIKDGIGERIGWYDAIANMIDEVLTPATEK